MIGDLIRHQPRGFVLAVALFLLAWGVRPASSATCTVASTNIQFGNFSGTTINISGTITVKCTNGSAYNVGIDAGTGAGATVTDRRMTSTGSALLGYELFSDAAHSVKYPLRERILEDCRSDRLRSGEFRSDGLLSESSEGLVPIDNLSELQKVNKAILNGRDYGDSQVVRRQVIRRRYVQHLFPDINGLCCHPRINEAYAFREIIFSKPCTKLGEESFRSDRNYLDGRQKKRL